MQVRDEILRLSDHVILEDKPLSREEDGDCKALSISTFSSIIAASLPVLEARVRHMLRRDFLGTHFLQKKVLSVHLVQMDL